MLKNIGKIEALYINSEHEEFSTPVESISLTFEGIIGDKHFGFTDVTGAFQEPKAFGIPREFVKDSEIINWRQWSAVSLEELQAISEKLGIEEDPFKLASLIRANILISGISNFTDIDPNSIIRTPSNAMLKVEAENFPCSHAGKKIQSQYKELSPSLFPKAAINMRGLVGTVFSPGEIFRGDRIEVYTRKTRR